MVNIICIHTGAAPDIYGKIESELQKRMTVPYQVSHYTDPGIIAEVSKELRVTTNAASRLLNMYSTAVNAGADIILHICSSVGAVSDAAEKLIEMTGTKILRIDHGMSAEAVSKYKKIAVVCTLRSTVVPSCGIVQACADEAGKEVEIQTVVADGTFGYQGKELSDRIIKAIEEQADSPEVLVFAQASMAGAAEAAAEYFGLPVLTSPEYAAQEIADLAAAIVPKKAD